MGSQVALPVKPVSPGPGVDLVSLYRDRERLIPGPLQMSLLTSCSLGNSYHTAVSGSCFPGDPETAVETFHHQRGHRGTELPGHLLGDGVRIIFPMSLPLFASYGLSTEANGSPRNGEAFLSQEKQSNSQNRLCCLGMSFTVYRLACLEFTV